MKTTRQEASQLAAKVGQSRRAMARSRAVITLAVALFATIEIHAQYPLSSFGWGDPTGINNSGTIVANGYDPDTFEGVPVLVNGDSVTVIPIPNALYPTTGGINAQGTIVGYAYTEDFSIVFGFVRTKQGKVTSLTMPGASATMPSGINPRGVVVGSVVDEESLSHGFLWDAAGPTVFDAPGADSTELTGINASGTAVGNYGNGGISRAFTLAGSTFSPLDIPDALSSSALAINGPGQIVGYYQSSADPHLNRGFVSDRGVVTPVDYVRTNLPPSFPPRAFDRGALGHGTVTYVRTDTYTAVRGINDHGDIVGRSAVVYTPMVECGGCGLTSDDFFYRAYLDDFTGERDGSRTVHVKKAGAGKREPLEMRLSPGTAAREVQSLIRGRRP